MAEDIEARGIEAHLRDLDKEMKAAKTQAEKDAIEKRQDELRRQLEALRTIKSL